MAAVAGGALVLLAVLLGVAWFFLRGANHSAVEEPILGEVFRGPYEHVVIEHGEVESANNIEVRCEVRAREGSATSTAIIDIVPEGTWVNKGDWLITFDSSALEKELRAQRIAVNSREAQMIKAKAAYDTALIALKEYLDGAYQEQEQQIRNEIFLAEDALRRVQLAYDSTKRLVSRGLLTPLQLESEKFRVDAAANDLELAQRRLAALQQFTKAKMVTQLESDIKAAEVKYRNEKSSYEEERKKLQDIEDQVAKCRVVAPEAGQVVYANVQDHHGVREFVVEPGAMVRERQVLIHLPDPRHMQVRAELHESRINVVREGFPAIIRIDAFGDRILKGQVTQINRYAQPTNFWNSASKQYLTLIQIHDPPPDIRVGLTAEVKIVVSGRDDTLQIPISAVYERNGKTFCLVKSGAGWETRQVVIRSSGAQTAAVDEELSDVLQPGELVVVNPRQHLDKFDAARFQTAEQEVPVPAQAARTHPSRST